MQLAPAGDHALLLDLGQVTAAELHAANARALTVPGVARSIPGHSSLYVIFDGAPDRDALTRALKGTSNQQPATSNTIHVPVAFNGEDLDEFLSHVNLTRDAFLTRVDGLRLTARYLGFRGGFAYLDGWPAEWSMPRRATSRPVARGSFAIAGSVAAFYPIDTPGGWNLLGRTDLDLENAIAPGDVLVLKRRARLQPAPPAGVGRANRAKRSPHEIQAPLATWTDRPFDDIAASLANRAAGNAPNAPLLECPLVGPKVRLTHDAVLAWCTPDLRVITERVRAGEERTFGRITGGLRGYLAIGAHEGAVESPRRDERHRIHVMRGPHDVAIGGDVQCDVTPQLDRVGIRLRPLQPLEVKIPADLRSIGMQCGTVQLHPDGSLVAMGPDYPVTGGYLQPLTLLRSERWKLAQLAPGERVTFVVQEPNS
jgi:allophanate hydrolase subunit 1